MRLTDSKYPYVKFARSRSKNKNVEQNFPYKKKKRKYEKQLSYIANFTTEDEIFKIYDSETSKQALYYLNIHATNAFADLSRSHFTRINDYILTNLTLNNASRPPAIDNMALREFKSAKKQGENLVVPVINHKTRHSNDSFQ